MFRLRIKAGAGEGYEYELLGIKNEIHFSSLSEAEIADFLPRAGFALSFLERWSTFDCECKIEGFCAIGSKAA